MNYNTTGSQEHNYNISTAALDEKSWDWVITAAGVMSFRAVNDANTLANSFMVFNRTGIVRDSIFFNATDLDFTGNMRLNGNFDITGVQFMEVSDTNDANQRWDARAEGTGARLHFYGQNDSVTSGNTGVQWNMYDGTSYATLDWIDDRMTAGGGIVATGGYVHAKRLSGSGDTHIAGFGNSSTAGDYVFGGNSTGALTGLDAYFRINQTAPYYNNGTVQREMWHEGNRPTIDNMAYKSNLNASENLDNYLVTGMYHQNSNADAATGSNYPQAVAGMLTVKEGDAFIYQYYHTYQPNNDVWVRSKYLTNWSAWEKTWTSGNDGVGSGLDADFYQGFGLTATGNRWGVMTNVSTSGVTEVGRYLDFHSTDADATDNTARFDNHTNGQVRMTSTATTDIFEVSNSSTEFSQLAANASGGYLVLSDDALTNTIIRGYGDSDFYAGSLFIRGTAGGFGAEHLADASFAMWSVGGGYYHTTTASVTGTIAIRLPATARNTSDMISFSVDIFDYAGGDGQGESIKVDIQGYPNTGGWANTNATIHTTKTDRDYNVRFYYDATYHYVYIGETTSNWAYPQVKVYNLFAGYTANIENWDDGWSVTIPSTFTGTLDHSVTSNLPTAGRVNLQDNNYIYFGTGTGESSLRSNGSDTYWDFRADRDLYLRDVTTTRFQFDISTGDLIAADFSATSDIRLKENIKDYEIKPIDTRWVTFDWKDGSGNGLGVIAQELEKNHPEFVKTDDNEGYKSVKYTKLLIAKMAEKDNQIESLEQRVDRLENLLTMIIK
jgi:hypothetical protein